MEFQNWKRRKSFDPMKAAAEGRKKEAAKKAAVSHNIHSTLTTSPSTNIMTQSVTLGNTLQTRGYVSVYNGLQAVLVVHAALWTF